MTTGTTLGEIVFASHKFRDVLEAARKLTVRSEFATVEWDGEAPSIDWGFALLYASAITSAESERAQAAVLRIATACMLSSETQRMPTRRPLPHCSNAAATTWPSSWQSPGSAACRRLAAPQVRSGWRSSAVVSNTPSASPTAVYCRSIRFRGSSGKR